MNRSENVEYKTMEQIHEEMNRKERIMLAYMIWNSESKYQEPEEQI